MTQTKLSEIYLCHLISWKRQILNTFNILVAVFSSAGVMGWKIWEYTPVIACVLVAIISLLKLVQPYILPSDKHLDKLDKICDFYYDKYLKLEDLFLDFENGIITEREARVRFGELKQKERAINTIINEVHRKTKKSLAEKAEKESIAFFNRVFNT